MDEVVFGRYRSLSLIGEGGMGELRAHDAATNTRTVAIKLPLEPACARVPLATR